MSDELVTDILDLGGDAIEGRYNDRMKVGVWLTQIGLNQPSKVEILDRTREPGTPNTYRLGPQNA